ncbi:agamous-like MADS-box protein AGL80 [Carica papaya]|uniref:agamous-like MADS-box protein AGL80 n=1 Tax=Carica papaya TaxID=3649 RepID=UPI000B8CB616|nr:agamous-like MADS-box protein AGL80 [Carica papaya]
MTKKNVKLAYITNDSARKAMFKQRNKGLMKKVSELSTLCDVKACAIIYSPYDSKQEVWPSPFGAQCVLSDFKRLPEMEQSKKMVNQESFLCQKIAKATDQLKKQCKDNREKEITYIIFQSLIGKPLHQLNLINLKNLGWLIEQYFKEIQKSIGTLWKSPQPQEATDAGVMKGPKETFTKITEDHPVQMLQQL